MDEESKVAEEGIEKLIGDENVALEHNVDLDTSNEISAINKTTDNLGRNVIPEDQQVLTSDQKAKLDNIIGFKSVGDDAMYGDVLNVDRQSTVVSDGIPEFKDFAPGEQEKGMAEWKPAPGEQEKGIAKWNLASDTSSYASDLSPAQIRANKICNRVLAAVVGCVIAGVGYYIYTGLEKQEAMQTKQNKARLAAVAKLSKFITGEYVSLLKQIQTAKNAGKLSKTFNFEGATIPYGQYFLSAVKPPFTQFAIPVGKECAMLQVVRNTKNSSSSEITNSIASLQTKTSTAGENLITALEKLQSTADIAVVMKLADITFPISTIQDLLADVNNASTTF